MGDSGSAVVEGQTSRFIGLIKKAAHQNRPAKSSIVNSSNGPDVPRLVQVVDSLRQIQHLAAAKKEDAQNRRPPVRSLFQQIRRRGKVVVESDIKQLIQKLSPFPFLDHQKRLLSDYCEVRKWVFESNQYLQWLRGRSWHLCCYGEPGCGKTTFAAAIAQNIRAREKFTAVVLFFDQNDPNDNFDLLTQPRLSSSEAVLRAILRQVLEVKVAEDQHSALVERLESSKTSTVDLSVDDLRAHIAAELATYTGRFIIIDGLEDEDVPAALVDELKLLGDAGCGILFMRNASEDRGLQFIQCDRPGCGDSHLGLYWRCLSCLDPTSFDLCVPCYEAGHKCPIDGLHTFSEPYTTVELCLRTPEREVMAYFREQLQREVKRNGNISRQMGEAEKIIETAENAVAAHAAGAFVFAKLYIDYITQGQSLDDLLNVLDRLPQHEHEYFNGLMYKTVHNQHSEHDKRLALATLAVAAHASREAHHMAVEELLGAVQHLLRADQDFPPEASERRLIHLTHGFLMVQHNDALGARLIVPFHEAAGIYLYENCAETFRILDFDMTLLCLTRLSLFTGTHGQCDSDPWHILREIEDQPFLYYALRNWGFHLAQRGTPAAIDAAVQYLEGYSETSANFRKALYLLRSATDRANSCWYSSPAHICAYFGLVEVFEAYQKRHPHLDVNIRDAVTLCTPLVIASKQGNVKFVETLLAAGADSSLSDRSQVTPLSAAIEVDDTSVLSQILDNSSPHSLNATLSNDQTPLMMAIVQHRQDMTEALLCHENIDLGISDVQGRTALHLAVDAANLEAIETAAGSGRPGLSEHVNRRDSLGRTVLASLLQTSDIEADRLPTVKSLVDCGSDPLTVDKAGKSLLHLATSSASDPAIIEYLISQGVHVNALDSSGWTALHEASAWGGIENVKVLLEHDADSGIKDCRGHTALDVAILCQMDDIAGVLQALDSPLTSLYSNEDAFEEIPAWRQIDRDTEKFVAQYGQEETTFSQESILALDPLDFTALHWAVEKGDQEVVRLILDDGRVDVNALNACGDTALILAMKRYVQQGRDNNLGRIVDVLLDDKYSADVAATDGQGHRALDIAVQSCAWDMSLRLIERRAEVALPWKQTQRLFEEAVSEGRSSAIPILLDAGADPLQYDLERMLPSRVAAANAYDQHLRDLLQEAENNALNALV